MNYTIRKARSEDLEALTEIERVCFPEAEAAKRKDLAERLRTCKESFFVAELADDMKGGREMDGASLAALHTAPCVSRGGVTLDSRLIGMVNGCVCHEEHLTDDLYHESGKYDDDGDYQMIFGLDVIPKYQGQGIGSALMKHMISDAKERGKKAVVLTCKEEKIPFYERLGCQMAAKSDSTHGGAVWYEMKCGLCEKTGQQTAVDKKREE